MGCTSGSRQGSWGNVTTKLISERITVEFTESPAGLKEPAVFTWRGKRHVIRQVLSAWVDAGFGAGEVTRTWYNRRHRNYYRVETDEGEIYELYLDRSGSKRDWILARRLGTDENG